MLTRTETLPNLEASKTSSLDVSGLVKSPITLPVRMPVSLIILIVASVPSWSEFAWTKTL